MAVRSRDCRSNSVDLLASEHLKSWPKVTGGKDIHVVVPIERSLTQDEAHAYCKGLAERLAATAPTTTAVMAKRGGKLFIDYLRNGRGTTAIGTYSPRARPSFPVAARITWKQVESGIKPDAFHM